ncbi:MAG TPA: hypothetical protein VFG28_15850 [Syntrophales bacterium]|nr:hypothetical protein [Syntrophales bacterium]
MTTVLWVRYLKNGNITSEQQDLWALYHFSDHLDRLCANIGIRPLSEFHDAADVDEEEGPAPAPHESAGTLNEYLTMASRGQWYPPEEGLDILDKLLDTLRRSPVRFGLLKDHYIEVMVDLAECRQSIEKARREGAKFKLCAVKS